jgi:acetylornithine deacetylase/succinyl-diaminopimelate desuccinylase-like protein
VLLNGHVDTVLAAEGWSCDPWEGRRHDQILYGLGSADMKGGVAAIMLAMRALARRRDLWRGTVICTTVPDEEAYSIGARTLIDAGIKADVCVVAEPAWERPIIGGVGKVLIRGEVTGKAAHGSWPDEGINAAVEAAKLIARLDTMPLGRHPRLTASQCLLSMHSGSEQYVITVPEKASFTINRHIVPGESGESVLAEMEQLAASLNSPARFTFAIEPPYYPAWETPIELPAVQRFAAAYEAETGHAPVFAYAPNVSDANYFSADAGIPTLYFGPHGEGLHQCDEWVDVSTIAGTVRVLLRFATAVMSRVE